MHKAASAGELGIEHGDRLGAARSCRRLRIEFELNPKSIGVQARRRASAEFNSK
jgi:hypothetical protein